ncbi:hypothetical protein [Thermoplasma volcanium]|nr:hypothetical protein [Thermoplasma volcanium]
MVVYILSGWILFGYSDFPLIVIAILLFSAYYIHFLTDIEWKKVRLPAFYITLFIMFYIGGIIQIPLPNNAPIAVDSALSVFTAMGAKVSLLDSGGVFVISKNVVVLMSPWLLLMFVALSSLVAENYYQIISYASGAGNAIGSVVYGLTSAFSCQCESYISLLPALAAVIIDTVLLPVVFLSLFLLIFTYIFVSMYYKKGKHVSLFSSDLEGGYRKLAISFYVTVLCLIPALDSILVGIGYEKNLIFFFVSGMGMVLEGFVLSILLTRFTSFSYKSTFLALLFSLLGLILSFLWYYPNATYFAYYQPAGYGLMSFLQLLAGVFVGLGYSLYKNRYLFLEYITVAYSILPLAIFYLSNVAVYNLWVRFPLEYVTLATLFEWVSMLPLMWFSTHLSLNNIKYSEGSKVIVSTRGEDVRS